MNILKHMEAVFIASAALAISSSYIVDTLPEAHARPVAVATSAAAVPVVVVSAKRMSPQEKQQSLQAEANHQASRI